MSFILCGYSAIIAQICWKNLSPSKTHSTLTKFLILKCTFEKKKVSFGNKPKWNKPLLNIYARKMKILIPKDICTTVFMTSLFILAKPLNPHMKE